MKDLGAGRADACRCIVPFELAAVSGNFARKVPLSCWFGVAIAQRFSDFDCFARAEIANHAIVTLSAGTPISEFLIVGCQHGWLRVVGYDRGGFEEAVILTGC